MNGGLFLYGNLSEGFQLDVSLLKLRNIRTPSSESTKNIFMAEKKPWPEINNKPPTSETIPPKGVYFSKPFSFLAYLLQPSGLPRTIKLT